MSRDFEESITFKQSLYDLKSLADDLLSLDNQSGCVMFFQNNENIDRMNQRMVLVIETVKDIKQLEKDGRF